MWQAALHSYGVHNGPNSSGTGDSQGAKDSKQSNFLIQEVANSYEVFCRHKRRDAGMCYKMKDDLQQRGAAQSQGTPAVLLGATGQVYFSGGGLEAQENNRDDDNFVIHRALTQVGTSGQREDSADEEAQQNEDSSNKQRALAFF